MLRGVIASRTHHTRPKLYITRTVCFTTVSMFGPTWYLLCSPAVGQQQGGPLTGAASAVDAEDRFTPAVVHSCCSGSSDPGSLEEGRAPPFPPTVHALAFFPSRRTQHIFPSSGRVFFIVPAHATRGALDSWVSFERMKVNASLRRLEPQEHSSSIQQGGLATKGLSSVYCCCSSVRA